MTQKDRKILIAELLNRCWDDETFKAQFIENPAKVLAEAGLPVDAEKTYRVVENTDSVQYVVLPEKDAAAVLEQLKNAAAQKENFISAGKEVRFVQNSADVKYVLLPQQHSERLTDEQLDQIAGGGWFYTDSNIVVQTEAVAQFHTAVQLEVTAAEVSVAAVVTVVV